MQATLCVVVLLLLFGSLCTQNCSEDCTDDSKCCLLQGEFKCTSTVLFNCGYNSPHSACSVDQCPLPTSNILCDVGSHRYYYCSGDNCCQNQEQITAEFIRPAEDVPKHLQNDLWTVSNIYAIVSLLALIYTISWQHFRSKNRTVVVLNMIGHVVMLYIGFFSDAASCYVMHFVGGPPVYQFSWNSRIFNMMFQNQLHQLELLKRKQLFSRKIGQKAMQQIKRQESFVALLASPTIGLFIGLCSLVYGAVVLYILTDISMFETSTCICPHINMGKYGVTMGLIGYVILGTLAIRYYDALDAYATRWETYTYITGRLPLQVLIIIMMGIHVLIHRALALATDGHIYSPYIAGKLALTGACMIDMFITVWMPLAFELKQKLFVSAKAVSKTALDHDDVFLGQLASYAVREYSIDALLCWRMIRTIQEERSTKVALQFVELYLDSNVKCSNVDLRSCLKDMRDVNDVVKHI